MGLSSKLQADFRALLENMKTSGKSTATFALNNKETIEALTKALKGSGAKIKTISIEDLGLDADPLGDIENVVQAEVQAALGSDGSGKKLDLKEMTAKLKEKILAGLE